MSWRLCNKYEIFPLQKKWSFCETYTESNRPDGYRLVSCCHRIVCATHAARRGAMCNASTDALPSSNCPRETILDTGPATELKTGPKFFLDYPCDLKKGEKITFVLSLHGGGSIPNWQRHYFPLLDYTDKYRLVVANRRFAATLIKFPKPQRSGSGAHGRARRRAGFSARPAVVRFLSYLRDGRT